MGAVEAALWIERGGLELDAECTRERVSLQVDNIIHRGFERLASDGIQSSSQGRTPAALVLAHPTFPPDRSPIDSKGHPIIGASNDFWFNIKKCKYWPAYDAHMVKYLSSPLLLGFPLPNYSARLLLTPHSNTSSTAGLSIPSQFGLRGCPSYLALDPASEGCRVWGMLGAGRC
ncbi:hypothetical protein FS749_011631 [Ceratobasidium sp. UAMH 11750]|nr:hypothetical protein FS749_011631 [Ceratobasidium sp. UAMH 11750]